MVRQLVYYYSGLSPQSLQGKGQTVIRNALGILQNISSEGDYAYGKLRQMEGLIPILVQYMKLSVDRNEINDESTENVVCVLRNISYRYGDNVNLW